MAPLERLIRARIAERGPMRLDDFMALALGHPEHGYYMTRDPLGAAGDFTTAPEISQMFGELLGLWAADVWTKLGGPARFQLIECGPGRGTLMADALRAAAKMPGFIEAADIVLVEIGPALIEKQKATLSSYGVRWVGALDDLLVRSGQPVILLANEFLDALPIRQFRFSANGWQEKYLSIDDADALSLIWHPRAGGDPGDWARSRLAALDPRRRGDAGTIELSAVVETFASQVATLLRAGTGAALFIDYGYVGPAVGETLQALRSHRSVSPLSDIGNADLTAHVDFGALARMADIAVHGPADQGSFLRRLGIEARAAMLRPRAPEAVEAALHRLIDPSQMGDLFKVLAFSHGLAAPPEGF